MKQLSVLFRISPQSSARGPRTTSERHACTGAAGLNPGFAMGQESNGFNVWKHCIRSWKNQETTRLALRLFVRRTTYP